MGRDSNAPAPTASDWDEAPTPDEAVILRTMLTLDSFDVKLVAAYCPGTPDAINAVIEKSKWFLTETGRRREDHRKFWRISKRADLELILDLCRDDHRTAVEAAGTTQMITAIAAQAAVLGDAARRLVEAPRSEREPLASIVEEHLRRSLQFLESSGLTKRTHEPPHNSPSHSPVPQTALIDLRGSKKEDRIRRPANDAGRADVRHHQDGRNRPTP